MNNVIDYIQDLIAVANSSISWVNVIEVLIIFSILLIFYNKFIKNTQSERFVRGVFFLVFFWLVSEILISLNLRILGVFLKSAVTFILLSLIVIFQPELRKFLGFLGQIDFIEKFFLGSKKNVSCEHIDVVKEIIESVKYFSKSHIGALIVFQSDLSNTYYDVGTTLNADVSTELLLTIFHPNTPLHDGAVVINQEKIISAGVLLPLTEDPKLSWKYGTRHRAAIGMTEVSDSACLVVSEETGDVSITMDGTLKKYDDLASLKTDLENILCTGNIEKEKSSIFGINNFMGKKQ